ncbi:hypothetical protein COC69_32665 [Bacillus cereus]|uniref:Crystaline entomocidal protoxin n=1 Tax=Bacillus cereus TaxID=1396 RepID=A0A9X7CGU0_BACCE|nr:insecticidal delta-endotoxin Cry8Ea1 family protein [Bacillus cereus]PGS61775.1 hypothetical protein COC69_32665 [Bacillus cereus]
MKYKDRIQAKRNYKQAIFATATTLTLGVSALAGPASAFAAEQKTADNIKAVQTQSQIKAMTDLDTNNFDKFINGQHFSKDSDVGKFLIKLKTIGINSLTKSANNGTIDFNNFARDLVISGAGLIPFGGAILSPFIAMLWPQSSQSQMDQLVKKFSAMMDEKIVDYDNGALKQQAIALQDRLAAFENLVNRIEQKTSTFITDQDVAAQQALALNDAFNDLLRSCQKDEQKKSELPLYTQIATAHLVFLKYVVENGGKGTILNFQQNGLQLFKDAQEKAIKEYPQYIAQVAYQALAQISTKELGFSAVDNEEYTHQIYIGAKKTYDSLQRPLLPKEKEQLEQAIRMMNKIEGGYKLSLPTNAANAVYAYRANTVDNLAFNTILNESTGNKKTGWVRENNIYFYEKDGIRQNSGWFKDGDAWYYLDHKDGHMATGWVKDNDKWYFLSAFDDPKYNFKHGQMYFQPKETGGRKNASILIDDGYGKHYNFDENGVCLNPNGE